MKIATNVKFIILASVLVILAAGSVRAHGVELTANIQARMNGQLATYTEETLPSNALVSEIEIVAKYTNGEPMSGGYVRVFAPDDRTTPWVTGNCDRQGRFTFTPDRSKPGRWTIRVQAADHSNFINILIR